LGRTGVQVSALALGTMNFGGRADAATSAQIISEALAHGVNFIDTANVYGHNPANFREGRGRSEEIIGQALKQHGDRTRLIVATKAYFPMSDDINAQGNNRQHLIAQCEASLRRLGTDYIDLYQWHHPSNIIPIDETLRALDDLVRAGKIRYIGTSSFAVWQLVESLWVSKEYGLNRVICEQPVYNLLDRRIERELVPMAQTYGVVLMIGALTVALLFAVWHWYSTTNAQRARQLLQTLTQDERHALLHALTQAPPAHLIDDAITDSDDETRAPPKRKRGGSLQG
jgi:aryl-alcohol dehydrogenase-like predicted oxidoreductase